MTGIWIAVVSMSLLLTGFTFSLKLSAINRTFLLLPSGIMENAVATIGLTAEEKPYYIASQLEYEVQSYFVDNLKNHVASFSISITILTRTRQRYTLDRYDGVTIGFRPLSYLITSIVTASLSRLKNMN
jgi:hypothetical protein